MKTISKINHMLCRIEGWVMVLWFSAVMVVMTAQVISRYILSSPIQWSEEFARYSFVWISYIGCAYCIGVDGHTSITAVRDRLPHKGQKIMLAIGNIIIACVFTRLMPIAINYIAKNGKFPTSVMYCEEWQISNFGYAYTIQISLLFICCWNRLEHIAASVENNSIIR